MATPDTPSRPTQLPDARNTRPPEPESARQLNLHASKRRQRTAQRVQPTETHGGGAADDSGARAATATVDLHAIASAALLPAIALAAHATLRVGGLGRRESHEQCLRCREP